MNFSELWEYANNLSQDYNLSANIFIITYLTSILPFYSGYFLMVYGSTREMSWLDVLRFKLKKLKWNNEFKLGLIVHLFGRAMPYAYVAFWGENLPLIVYIIIFIALFLPLIYFIKKLYAGIKFFQNRNSNSIIVKKEIINNFEEAEKLWEIYHASFSKLNKQSPCKQSFDHDHFIEALKNSTVFKYLLLDKETNDIIGIAMVTNNLKNSPWISEEYFEHQFSSHFINGLVYYFMGLAIDKKHSGKGHSISLIEKIIDDLPNDIIMGFDHSYNANPFLHYFTHIVKQKRFLKRKHIDRQNYHIVHRKS